MSRHTSTKILRKKVVVTQLRSNSQDSRPVDCNRLEDKTLGNSRRKKFFLGQRTSKKEFLGISKRHYYPKTIHYIVVLF